MKVWTPEAVKLSSPGGVLVGRMRNLNSISPDSALMKVWAPKAVKPSSPNGVLVGRMRNYNRRK